ncbi:YggS family pyridoxal phosphate-dependent enzyme [Mesonia sp. HuA40]|uniref:YggS family pyridoxal phosphate-dependent enzyme n=1 Tax=Mesonia sp. HuA40 TaxID=2602761 RepID=UPI0011CA65DB|nr:YggS family pyridoxal phosphate-dependent enzyme [Mesonia sp. HuA40]TXK74326.1 YggS family pyridoxal phosphate-dependent enzyme [Mesonia sp. HuA40]
MSNISANLNKVLSELPKHVQLVAVSKTKSEQEILQAYEAGQRIFGENKIQEMTDKQANLPSDIQWHMIGHVQTNKVKYMAPYVQLIHGVHKMKLLKEINKEAKKNERVIDCLLQIKIAEEDTKYGMDLATAEEILSGDVYTQMKNVKIVGLMGMATFTEDTQQIHKEFEYLSQAFNQLKLQHPELKILSMGMSGDYKIALEHQSNMLRIGSAIFGARNY